MPSDPNGITRPDGEITLADIWDAVGSLAVRVRGVQEALEHLTFQVAKLTEHDRPEVFADRVRQASNGSLLPTHNED